MVISLAHIALGSKYRPERQLALLLEKLYNLDNVCQLLGYYEALEER